MNPRRPRKFTKDGIVAVVQVCTLGTHIQMMTIDGDQFLNGELLLDLFDPDHSAQRLTQNGFVERIFWPDESETKDQG